MFGFSIRIWAWVCLSNSPCVLQFRIAFFHWLISQNLSFVRGILFKAVMDLLNFPEWGRGLGQGLLPVHPHRALW